MSSDRIVIQVPSCFVTPPPKKPEPPPVPGTVTAAMLGLVKPKDPPTPFLVPWKQFNEIPRLASDPENAGKVTFPVMVDPKVLAQHTERHEILETTLAAVFKGRPDAAALSKAVIQSMENPFASNSSPIVWTLDRRVHLSPAMDRKMCGKKLRGEARHRALLQGIPWSIKTFGEPGSGPRKNIIIGPDGHAIAQVDFGHGASSSCGIHAHALVKGNLEHTAVESEDHLFHLRSVPWMWCVIPDVTMESVMAYLSKKKGGAMTSNSNKGGDDDDEVSDEDANEMLSLASPLPDTREQDKTEGWVKVSLPYEDYVGSASTSFE